MRLLHTSDWHLGKLFYERSLEEDQKEFLNQTAQELHRAKACGKPYSALLISGDIYDRAVPPASATVMLDSFLTDILSALPKLHVFMLAGNHDSAERLSYGKAFFERHNLHVCTSCKNAAVPVIVDGAAVYQIPYLTPSRMSGHGALLRGQQEMLDEVVQDIAESHRKNHPGIPAVLSAHLFASGAARSESERIFVGNAEQVDIRSLGFFAYVALGHIHSAQKAARNAWYSGSPLSYSFGEHKSGKCMLSVTIGDDSGQEDGIRIERVPYRPLHNVTTITAGFDSALQNPQWESVKDDYIQVRCTDRAGIQNPMASLSRRFPNILSFVYDSTDADGTLSPLGERRKLLGKKDGDPLSVLGAFLEDIYGAQDDGSAALFDAEKKEFSRILSKLEEDG